jgi:hypothetical protein
MPRPAKRQPARQRTIRSLAQLEALSQPQREAHAKALHALGLMRRERLSLQQAALRADTTPAIVRRYAGSALERSPGGRYVARPADRLLVVMPALTTSGPQRLPVRGSRQRSVLSRHAHAIDRYLATGETDQLASFKGKKVAGAELETDRDAIDFWFAREPFTFEEIYDLGR